MAKSTRYVEEARNFIDRPQTPAGVVMVGGFHPALMGCHKVCNQCHGPSGA